MRHVKCTPHFSGFAQLERKNHPGAWPSRYGYFMISIGRMVKVTHNFARIPQLFTVLIAGGIVFTKFVLFLAFKQATSMFFQCVV
jgi:hypothetical protein